MIDLNAYLCLHEGDIIKLEAKLPGYILDDKTREMLGKCVRVVERTKDDGIRVTRYLDKEREGSVIYRPFVEEVVFKNIHDPYNIPKGAPEPFYEIGDLVYRPSSCGNYVPINRVYDRFYVSGWNYIAGKYEIALRERELLPLGAIEINKTVYEKICDDLRKSVYRPIKVLAYDREGQIVAGRYAEENAPGVKTFSVTDLYIKTLSKKEENDV